MKKIGIIIIAVALLLGLTKCRKPDLSMWDSGSQMHTITFTNSTNGGQKGLFQEDVAGVLSYHWENGDVIHVYSTTNADKYENKPDFRTNSKHCGVLNEMRIVNNEGTIATFKGNVEIPNNTKFLRFVHYGKSVVVTNGSTTIDYATQYGTEESLSNKLVAYSDVKYNGYTYEGYKLSIAFAIAKYSFANFSSDVQVTLKTTGNTEINVTEGGYISYQTPGKINFNIVTTTDKNNNKNSYFAVMMPKESTTYTFSDNVKQAEILTKDIKENSFYANVESGNPIALDAKPIETDLYVNFNDMSCGVTGLPLWAKKNVGAYNDVTVNSWRGNYYSWGEIEMKNQYNSDNYRFGTTMTKYNNTDGKTILDDGDDAANYYWGDNWRMPTGGSDGDFQKLKDNTYWVWTTRYNGVYDGTYGNLNGYIVYKVKDADHKGWWTDKDNVTKNKSGAVVAAPSNYSTTDTHIFIPAAGYINGITHNQVGVTGTYWSKSRCPGESYMYAYYLGFESSQSYNFIDVQRANSRYLGFFIRPVRTMPY